MTVTRIHARQRTLGLITARDITERRQAEEALRRSERYYKSLFESAHDAILLIDPNTKRILDVNRRACELYGYDRQEFLALSLHDITADSPNATEQGGPGVVCRRAAVHRRKDGGFMHMEVNHSAVTSADREAILCINRDVTERNRLEERLRQAQKMEAVGRLAGGIAHDFNNLLTVVVGYSDCLVNELSSQPQAREMAQEISKAADRAAELTGQLLAFGRKALVCPRVLELNAAVSQTESLLRRLIGEDVELVVELSPTEIKTRIDPGQLHQVLLNLSVNARDAMPRGGRLTIAIAATVFDEDGVRTKPNLHPGDYAVLTVTDTGCGMSPEVLAHLFEPFFTTKEIGKGTGLGLATAYGIVEQAGGHTEVESNTGAGTTFRIYLPRVEAPAGEPPAPPPPLPLPGAETVLLVEDEAMIRSYAALVLREQGYHVIEASDGSEALELCRRHQGPLHLLLTDVVLPRLGGRELAERSAALRPGLRVLFISGYTEDTVLRHGVIKSDVHFLAKPFTPAILIGKVRAVLDGPGSGVLPPFSLQAFGSEMHV